MLNLYNLLSKIFLYNFRKIPVKTILIILILLVLFGAPPKPLFAQSLLCIERDDCHPSSYSCKCQASMLNQHQYCGLDLVTADNVCQKNCESKDPQGNCIYDETAEIKINNCTDVPCSNITPNPIPSPIPGTCSLSVKPTIGAPSSVFVFKAENCGTKVDYNIAITIEPSSQQLGCTTQKDTIYIVLDDDQNTPDYQPYQPDQRVNIRNNCLFGDYTAVMEESVSPYSTVSNPTTFKVTALTPPNPTCCEQADICMAINKGECIPTSSTGVNCACGCIFPKNVECGGNMVFNVCTPTANLICTNSYGNAGIESAVGCVPLADKYCKEGDLQAFANWILGRSVGIGGGIAFILIIYSGFLIMTSAGNPKRTSAGKELLTAAISGLILILFSVYFLKFANIDILKFPI